MHNHSNKDSEQSSVHSTSNCLNNCPSWWNSSGSYIPQSSYSKNINMNTDSIGHVNQIKHLGHQMPDQDSSSTQSTGQSLQEVSGTRGGNLHEQCVSAQSGHNNTYGKEVEGHMKPVLSLGTPEVIFQPPKLDYSQSVACIPYPYVDPFFGAVASYGSHAIIHPQMVGLAPSARVPLPLEAAEEEPIYVNAKQYHGILRRRQLRAKLEAQNKLLRGRKPYLHESRHLHAIKRARGSGGRFLNMKQLQDSKPATTADGQNVSGAALLQLGGDGRGIPLGSETLRSENGTRAASTTPTCSEVTTVSDSRGTFQHQDHLSFSANFHPATTGSMQGGGSMIHYGSHQRVPVMR